MKSTCCFCGRDTGDEKEIYSVKISKWNACKEDVKQKGEGTWFCHLKCFIERLDKSMDVALNSGCDDPGEKK